jgi:hypothetical protein
MHTERCGIHFNITKRMRKVLEFKVQLPVVSTIIIHNNIGLMEHEYCDHITENEMGGARGTYGVQGKCKQGGFGER